MVDTGATYSCIGEAGSTLPLSGSSVKTIGFSGKTQLIPLTQPIPILVIGKTEQTPINLLGRDIPCPLRVNIMCTPEEIWMDLPLDSSQSSTPMMSSLAVTNAAVVIDPAVYWVQLRQDSHLKRKWAQWETWVKGQLNDARTPKSPWHCTLMYDKQQTHVDYDDC